MPQWDRDIKLIASVVSVIGHCVLLLLLSLVDTSNQVVTVSYKVPVTMSLVSVPPPKPQRRKIISKQKSAVKKRVRKTSGSRQRRLNAQGAKEKQSAQTAQVVQKKTNQKKIKTSSKKSPSSERVSPSRHPGDRESPLVSVQGVVGKPKLALNYGWKGTVKVRFQIGSSGQVFGHDILESSGYDVLDEHFTKIVVTYWRFKPKRKLGSNVSGNVTLSWVYD